MLPDILNMRYLTLIHEENGQGFAVTKADNMEEAQRLANLKYGDNIAEVAGPVKQTFYELVQSAIAKARTKVHNKVTLEDRFFILDAELQAHGIDTCNFVGVQSCPGKSWSMQKRIDETTIMPRGYVRVNLMAGTRSKGRKEFGGNIAPCVDITDC